MRPESTSCRARMKSCSRSPGKTRCLMKPSTMLLGSGLSRLKFPLVVGSSRLASSVWVQFSTNLSSSPSMASSIIAAGVSGSVPGLKPQCGQTGEAVSSCSVSAKQLFRPALRFWKSKSCWRGMRSMVASFCRVLNRSSLASWALRLSSLTPRRAFVCRAR